MRYLSLACANQNQILISVQLRLTVHFEQGYIVSWRHKSSLATSNQTIELDTNSDKARFLKCFITAVLKWSLNVGIALNDVAVQVF
jgi:hypothetical protein